MLCKANFYATIILMFGFAAQLRAASFTPLGDLPGSLYHSQGYGISGDGNTVVGTTWSFDGVDLFRWTPTTGMQSLGDLPGGYFSGYAADASYDGSVIVGQSHSSNGNEAVVWTQEDGLVGIGDLPGGSFNSFALGVSDDGTVVGGHAHNNNNRPEGFVWMSGAMSGVGDLASEPFTSNIKDVSADGLVLVGSGNSGNQEPMYWTATTGPIGIGHLPGGTPDVYPAANGVAQAVSATGSVIVGQVSSALGNEAFYWTAAGGMIGLGALPGAVYSSARGVNADGSIVVGISRDELSDTQEAFVWTASTGMVSLESLLGNAVPVGWDLTQINGVSNDGDVVVGTGTNPDGHTEAFVATIGILGSPLIGDLDCDGFVGISDLSIILAHWNQNVPPANALADPSGDGFVGIDDLNLVLSNWNVGTPPTSQNNIPEPTSLGLLAAGVWSLLSRRMG